MTEKVVIMVTVSTEDEGRKIARHLVESRLAACANLTQAIESFYRWEGEIADDKEFQLFIKSTRELFPEIQAAVCKLHSYQMPEIICLPVFDGSQEYLGWVGDSVKRAGPVEVDEAGFGTKATDES